MDNLTSNHYKGNLVQVIEIDIRGRIYLEEGVFITLNTYNSSAEVYGVSVWLLPGCKVFLYFSVIIFDYWESTYS